MNGLGRLASTGGIATLAAMVATTLAAALAKTVGVDFKIPDGGETIPLPGLIRYEVGDAFDPAPTEQTLGGRPDVIVVSGLYELILDDDLVRRSIGRLHDLLAPGGTLVFTTQIEHPQLAMIAGVLTNRDGEPWVMRCRSVDDVETWARAAGFDAVSSRAEQVGLFTVTTASVITAADFTPAVTPEPKD